MKISKTVTSSGTHLTIREDGYDLTVRLNSLHWLSDAAQLREQAEDARAKAARFVKQAERLEKAADALESGRA